MGLIPEGFISLTADAFRIPLNILRNRAVYESMPRAAGLKNVLEARPENKLLNYCSLPSAYGYRRERERGQGSSRLGCFIKRTLTKGDQGNGSFQWPLGRFLSKNRRLMKRQSHKRRNFQPVIKQPSFFWHGEMLKIDQIQLLPFLGMRHDNQTHLCFPAKCD